MPCHADLAEIPRAGETLAKASYPMQYGKKNSEHHGGDRNNYQNLNEGESCVDLLCVTERSHHFLSFDGLE